MMDGNMEGVGLGGGGSVVVDMTRPMEGALALGVVLQNSLVASFRPEERLMRDTGNPPPGVVCLANEARFTSAFASEPLTAFTVGWTDTNNIEKTLDFLFPPVQAPRRFEFKKADNSEAFLSETDDVRSIGADFKHVEYRGSSVLEKTLNKGLTVRVDLDQVAGMPNWREVYTTRLLQRLLRNELRRAITAASAAASNTAKTWDTTAGKDPDQDVLTDLLTTVDDSGVRANRVLFGDVAWNKRLIAHRAQSSSGGYASAGMTTAELAAFYGVEQVAISRERYSTSATAKGKVVPDIVVSFYAEDGVTADDPTNTKRFWTPVDSGVAIWRKTRNSKKNNGLQKSKAPNPGSKRSQNDWRTPPKETLRPQAPTGGCCQDFGNKSGIAEHVGMGSRCSVRKEPSGNNHIFEPLTELATLKLKIISKNCDWGIDCYRRDSPCWESACTLGINFYDKNMRGSNSIERLFDDLVEDKRRKELVFAENMRIAHEVLLNPYSVRLEKESALNGWLY